MANQQRIALRTVIAGAAHGVWMAFLVGVAMMLLGLIGLLPAGLYLMRRKRISDGR